MLTLLKPIYLVVLSLHKNMLTMQKNAGKSTEQMKAGLKDAAKAGGGFNGVIANIGKTLGNMATGMAIGVAINLIIAGITNLVKA